MAIAHHGATAALVRMTHRGCQGGNCWRAQRPLNFLKNLSHNVTAQVKSVLHGNLNSGRAFGPENVVHVKKHCWSLQPHLPQELDL